MADDNVQHGIDDNPEGDAAKGAALGGVGGAAVGAAAGAMAGPVGMVVGAVVGGIAGAAASGAAVAAVDSMDNDNTLTGIGGGNSTDMSDRTDDRMTDEDDMAYTGTSGFAGSDAPNMSTDTLTGDRATGLHTGGTAMDGIHNRTTDRDLTANDEIRVPVMEEQAEVRKEAHTAGEVRLHKETEVETRTISEPVSHTEVDIERRDIAPGEDYQLNPNATTLREGETLRIPVVEEQLEVRTVPKVTGEVVVRTHEETEQVQQDVQLRKERVDVDRTDDVIDEARDLNVLDRTDATTRRSI